MNQRDQAQCRRLLADVLEGISIQLAAGHAVQLTGFGTFYTREQPAGTVTSFQTGKRQVVLAHRVAAFRVGVLLKCAVRKRSVGRPPRGGLSAALSRANHLLFATPHRSPQKRPR